MAASTSGMRRPVDAKLGTTLGIGQTDDVTVTLDKALPAGPWDAKLTLESGLTERSANATLTFPSSGTTTVTPERDDSFPIAPLAIGAGAVAAAALAWQVVRSRRTRSDVP